MRKVGLARSLTLVRRKKKWRLPPLCHLNITHWERRQRRRGQRENRDIGVFRKCHAALLADWVDMRGREPDWRWIPRPDESSRKEDKLVFGCREGEDLRGLFWRLPVGPVGVVPADMEEVICAVIAGLMIKAICRKEMFARDSGPRMVTVG